MKKIVSIAVGLSLVLTGCESILFYSQAAVGQLGVISARVPIEQLIEDPGTDPELKERLELVRELTAFAQAELALPVEGQYSHYADLKRAYVVWNVFAAPELSLAAKTWCYPIAGCAAYRGYFSEDSAEDFARNDACGTYGSKEQKVEGVPLFLCK